MISLRPRDQLVWDPRLVPHETKAETETSHCETETETIVIRTLLFPAISTYRTLPERRVSVVQLRLSDVFLTGLT